ncbi:MAG: alpha-ketoglutarate-dependent dioxygenase AlkB [Bacteroidota bacterium]|nr:alpha-ketoglutarate-dependent dioxygenase AlkB [Bacteroidota bacterium]
MEQDLFGNPIEPQKIKTIAKIGFNKIEGGEFIYYPNYFEQLDSDNYYSSMCDNIIWNQEKMNMYGKSVFLPRLTAWYGDAEKSYKFSGIKLNPHSWTPELLEIRNKINEIGKVSFNSVLLNRYRTGNDWISWHQDNEKELGINPVIGSVNFGATRKFQIRHLKTKEVIDILLHHGSLLVMAGALQHNWQHQVPKEKNVSEGRINLTFRVIL